jgi:LacI family transcriptional regulator
MITIDDIAREAGVSKMTVSRVLNGKGKNRRADARRRAAEIMEIASRSGYRPNAGAIAAATGTFNNISLVIGGTDKNLGFGWIPLSAILGISQRASAAGLTLSLAELASEQAVDQTFVPSTLRRWCTDGLIFNYIVNMPSRLKELVAQYRIPSVYMNVKMDANAVYPDDVLCGRELVRHVAELGHRRIGYINWHTSGGHYSAHDRLVGYRQEMQERGLKCREAFLTQEEIDQRGFPMGHRWLDQLGEVTAVIVDHKEDAIRLHLAALERGIAVPRQLSIVTVDDDMSSFTGGSDYSAMIVPFRRLGEETVTMLVERIRTGSDLKPRILMSYWHDGQTLAPPPSRKEQAA